MVTLYSLNLMQNAEVCFWSWLTDYLTQGHFDGELFIGHVCHLLSRSSDADSFYNDVIHDCARS